MSDPSVLQAVWLSATVATASVALTFFPALAVAWLLARKAFPGRAALHAFVMLPLVLPPVVTGYVLLVLFAPTGWIGGWLDRAIGVRLAFSWAGAVLAAGVVGFPLLVQQMRSSIEAVDPRYEVVSRSLGRSRWGSFRRVTLPLARPGIAAGALLAFARSLGEFGATITLAGYIEGETNTIALTIFRQLESPGGERIAAFLSLVAIAAAAAALGGYEALNRRHHARLEWHQP